MIKKEIRSGKIETRTFNAQLEIRSVDTDLGIFEGYASVFNVVDTYGSSIQRGAFSKTLRERGDKIKVLWNHEEDDPIGKPLEMREDDHGLYVRAQLTRGVQKADEALLLMKDGVINTLSIGFNVPRGKESIVDGVRQIHEVKLYEFSPVVFESNDQATINSVRSQDFKKTVEDENLEDGHIRLLNALRETLIDIWWGEGNNAQQVIELASKACDDFAAEYKAWATEYAPLTYHSGDEYRAAPPANNGLARTVLEYIRANKSTAEKMAMDTSLTIGEVRNAMNGTLQSSKMLTEFDDAVAVQYRAQRRQNIETIATHLRGDLNAAERNQLSALLDIKPLNSTNETEVAGEPCDAHSINQLRAEIKNMMESI